MSDSDSFDLALGDLFPTFWTDPNSVPVVKSVEQFSRKIEMAIHNAYQTRSSPNEETGKNDVDEAKKVAELCVQDSDVADTVENDMKVKIGQNWKAFDARHTYIECIPNFIRLQHDQIDLHLHKTLLAMRPKEKKYKAARMDSPLESEGVRQIMKIHQIGTERLKKHSNFTRPEGQRPNQATSSDISFIHFFLFFFLIIIIFLSFLLNIFVVLIIFIFIILFFFFVYLYTYVSFC